MRWYQGWLEVGSHRPDPMAEFLLFMAVAMIVAIAIGVVLS